MSVHFEYTEFRPVLKSRVDMKELYHEQHENYARGGKLGFLVEAVFRGIHDDIEKVSEIIGNHEITRVNDVVYEICQQGRNAAIANRVFDAIQKVPGCKVILLFDDRLYSQTAGSETGYPFITYTPREPDYHEKEYEGTWWYGHADPGRTSIGWDFIDYVVEADGKQMRINIYAEEGDVEVRFSEGGARIIDIHPQNGIVTVPETVRGERIIGVNGALFDEDSPEIPSGVRTIERFAFEDCSSLTKAELRNVTKIGVGAFEGCNSLEKVNFPDHLPWIAAYTFCGCSSLERAKIPNGVTKIGEYAFADCSSLTKIEIPDGVEYIDKGAFEGCTGLVSVKIPDSVKYIGSYAFADCSGLVKVDLPDSVECDRESVFRKTPWQAAQ